MGKWLTDWWSRLEKQYKQAFFGTFVAGLLTHMYMLTNKLPNHDYVYNIHGDQFYWPLSIGRWVLNLFAGLSSDFYLPWVNGVLAILWLSVAAGIVVAVLELKNAVPVLLCSALLAAYPALTDTMGYLFTVDAYMAGLLLSVLAVWFWEKKSGIARWFGCAVCIALAVGTYQAYLSFAVYLILIRLILDIFEQKYENRQLLKKAGCALISGVLGMAFYYIGLRIMMAYHHVGFADYMGIDEISVSGGPGRIFTVLIRDTVAFGEMFIGGNSEFTAYEIFNILFIIVLFAAYILIFVKTRLYRKKLQTLLLVIASLLLIPAAYLFDFISTEVVYRFLMLYCLVLWYILLVKLADRFLAGWFSEMVVVLIAAIVLNFALIANIAYMNLNLCWEQTYATAVRMQERITALDDGSEERQILIVGTIRTEGREWLLSRIPYLIGTDDVNLMRNQSFIITILNVDLGMNLDGVNNAKKEQIMESEEYAQMSCWPADGSVQMIENVIVIKLSED